MRISDWSSDVCSSDLAVCLLAGCIVLGALRDILDKIRHLGWLRGVPALGRGYWGMQLAHLGLAVCALGVVFNSVGSLERDLRMAPGDAVELGGYQFVFEGTTPHHGPNFVAERGSMRVLHKGRPIAMLHPEKRVYSVDRKSTRLNSSH